MKLTINQGKFLIYLYHKGIDKINSEDIEFPLSSDEIRELRKFGYIDFGMRIVVVYNIGNERVTQGTQYIEMLFKGMWICYLMKKELYEF